MDSSELRDWWDSVQSSRITYENARHIHEGWYGDDEPAPASNTDDPWEVLPCGHMRGELHDCTGRHGVSEHEHEHVFEWMEIASGLYGWFCACGEGL